MCAHVIYVHTYMYMYVCIHISSQRKSYHKFIKRLQSFQTFDVECSASQERVSNL